MVSDNTQGSIAGIGSARQFLNRFNQILKQIDVVIIMFVLQHRCQTFKAHASIN